jgi:Rieske Fe-S protein
MSTLCTYDRLPLKLEGNEAEGNKRFVSPYNGSVYSLQGEKISGPTRSPLKYYRLVIDSGVYGGPKDTLYVRIGDEVSPEWQLQP